MNERRSAKSRAVQLGKPFFMKVPKSAAASILTGIALVTIIASSLQPDIGFGAFFLLICAFGAWFVGNRFAALLGIFIALTQVFLGEALDLNHGPFLMALKFCSALAVVLMLGVARAALEIEWHFARIDPLTGAYNRKAFFEAVEKQNGLEELSLLIFADVDGLKKLNDQLGHEAGDLALSHFSTKVRNSIRSDDIFARVGGDEFVIFMRVRDLAAANTVATRLNATLNESVCTEMSELKCSLGALILPCGTSSIDGELKQADSLMYHAKRNRSGLLMAFSVPGDPTTLVPFAPTLNDSGHLRVPIRSKDRSADNEARSGKAKNPLAA
ncbi:GGDEF domain-containing protein [Croceicoccus sp. Ery5]|uniref:GGDEF domain-containing protein n=1 Tax=Croceicoccus sp. Ery5 TaxID=1703340 RepID=UPI001E5DE4F0|nr:GGDEF domain-containing protein [Croceicoccus sp. Ery5]